MAAATGIASTAPRNPPSDAPTASARMTATGCSVTTLPATMGPRNEYTNWSTAKTMTPVMIPVCSPTVSPTTTAMTALKIEPTNGMTPTMPIIAAMNQPLGRWMTEKATPSITKIASTLSEVATR
jgi:hypothetical protein